MRVEVVYASPDVQKIVALEVAANASVRDIIKQSKIEEFFPAADLSACPVGIFGKKIKDLDGYVAQEGDRFEIYRPLLVDPKVSRKLRAEKAAAARALRESLAEPVVRAPYRRPVKK